MSTTVRTIALKGFATVRGVDRVGVRGMRRRGEPRPERERRSVADGANAEDGPGAIPRTVEGYG